MADALEEDRRATREELSRATGVPATSVFRILTNNPQAVLFKFVMKITHP